MEKTEVDVLIDILLDANARIDEREDAAMDLAEYSDRKALSALVKVASNDNEKDLWEVSGESVATIMYNLDEVNMEVINGLTENARIAAVNYLESD